MCDLAGDFAWFENFTAPNIFLGVTITQDIQVRSFK